LIKGDRGRGQVSGDRKPVSGIRRLESIERILLQNKF